MLDGLGDVGMVGNFKLNVTQRWNRVNPAGRKQRKRDFPFSARFQHGNRADQIVVQKFGGTGLSIHACQNGGIRGGINQPVDPPELPQVGISADIPLAHIETILPQ
jgi:hypothetical protein